MGKRKEAFTALALAAALTLGLAACASPEQEETEQAAPVFDLVVAGLEVDLDRTKALESELSEQLTGLLKDGEPLNITELLLGEEVKATEIGIAMNAKAATLFASGGVDLLLADQATAAPYAAADCFLPLDELFSQEELTDLGREKLKFPILDSMNEPTGEETAEVGLDVSDVAALAELLPGAEAPGIYIAANTADPQQAKAVLLRLIDAE